MEVNERFWSSSLDEVKQGYIFDEPARCYYCLVCGESFEEGEIFRIELENRWFDARKYAAYHVEEKHGSMLDLLLALDKKMTGLTDLQKELIRDFADNLSDSDIVKRSGAGSASTIRNHRFVLKEKAKQARLLLAIMELMEQEAAASPHPVAVHRAAITVDDSQAMTEAEHESLMKQYFPDGPDGPIASIPRKQKRKLAVLEHIAAYFQSGITYQEKEVNELLRRFSEDDYVTLRRYLIDFGYLARDNNTSEYWVKEVVGAAGALEQSRGSKQETEEQQAQLGERKGGQKMEKTKRKQLTAAYQERERVMGVFQIKNNVNGRIYIGGSKNLDALWGKEQFTLNFDSHTNRELQKEWTHFGSENFSYLVLETVKLDQQIRYDYKDVFDAEGRQPVDMMRQYNKMVADLQEKWMEKLQPYGEQGYHSRPAEKKN